MKTLLVLLVAICLCDAQEVLLPATIHFSITTNWTTTATITPVIDKSNIYLAIYRPQGYVQSGCILSNTIATIKYNSKEYTVVLDSTQIGYTTRTIYDGEYIVK